MQESEKKYKIKKRTKYYEQLSELREEEKFTAFEFGAATIAALLGFSFSEKLDDIPFYLFLTGMNCINTGIAAYHLKKLIGIMNQKTVLQVNIENINNSLEMAKFEPKTSDLREIDEELQFKR